MVSPIFPLEITIPSPSPITPPETPREQETSRRSGSARPPMRRSDWGEWFHRPRTMGLDLESLALIYTILTCAVTTALLISRLKSFSELVSIDVVLLSVLLVTSLLSLFGIDKKKKALILPFLISAGFFTLFFVAYWFTQVISMFKNPLSDLLALLFILYMIGHGFRVILAVRKQIIDEKKQDHYVKFY